MRFIEVARKLGITAQQLRHEVKQINFGINVMEREIPENLALGVIRVLSPKFKKEMAIARKKEMELLKQDDPEASEVSSESEEGEEETEQVKSIRQRRAEEERRKKIEEYKKRQEDQERLRKEKKRGGKPKKPAPQDSRMGAAAAKAVVMRKIELDPEAVKKAQEKKVRKKEKENEAKIQEASKRAAKRLHTHGYTEEDLAQMSEEERLALVTEEMISKELEDEIFKKGQQKRTRIHVTKEQDQIKKKEGIVLIPEIVSVKEFAEKAGIAVPKVIETLMKNGIMVTINQPIDYDTAAIIAADLEVEVKKAENVASEQDIFEQNLEKLLKEEDPSLLKERPPVVVIMGHVDHGKTSILDYYRETNVVAGESGGITQHIGAYSIQVKKKSITFLDTPGHEAFTSMRARGAKVTDIAILVIAADEGFKPQSIEAANHAKEAGIPIIVALNKIDKEGSNPEMVKKQMSEHDLLPEDWGGKVPVVPCSTKTKEGMDILLETMLLVAEIEELKANPDRLAIGTVVESHLDKSLGPVATIIINTGTLKVGAPVVVGNIFGKVKTLIGSHGERLRLVGPSDAVQIGGLTEVPIAGDVLQVAPSEKDAKELVSKIKNLHLESKRKGLGVGEIMDQLSSGKMDLLKVVLKADTEGSIEAIRSSVAKIRNEDVAIKIIHAGTGAVSESDIMMAAASKGIVVSFHVACSLQVKKVADMEGVEIQNYTIVYELLDDLRKILTGMLKAEAIEVSLGKLIVKQVFYTKKKIMIVGCELTEGMVKETAQLRVIRNGEQVDTGKIETLKHFEKQVSQLEAKTECGIQFVGKISLQEGDELEAFEVEQRIKTLD